MTVTVVRTKLLPIAEGVVMAQPSPLTRVVYHQLSGTQKEIGYLGFTDPQLAEQCYSYLTSEAGRYSRAKDAGVCKPRKAKRVQGAALELKWHRPDAELLNCFIRKDLARV